MGRNWGFGVNVVGVGGIEVVVPIARGKVGGFVGRRVRMCRFGERGSVWVYYFYVRIRVGGRELR